MAFSLRSGIPIRSAAIGIIVSAMALMAAVLVAVSWVGTRQILLDSAWRSARDAGQLVNERALRTTAPAVATLRTLAYDPLLSNPAATDHRAQIDTLMAALVSSPLIASIYVAYDNGDMLLVRPLNKPTLRQHFDAPADAAFLVQASLHHDETSPTYQYHFYNGEGQKVSSRVASQTLLDLRERDWFQSAMHHPQATVLTRPYMFLSSQQLGVSLARQANNGKAVIGMDIEANELIAVLERLRITPGTQVALVDHHDEVMLYQDMHELLTPSASLDGPHATPLPALAELAGGVLLALQQQHNNQDVVSLEVGDRQWLGMVLPFTALGDVPLQLLLVMPTDELLLDLQRHRQRLILISILLILPFLLLGWRGGSFIARQLERLAARTRQLSAFDFRRTQSPPSALREINTLNRAIHDVSETVEAMLETSRILNSEKQLGTMLDSILATLLAATRCQAGAVYLWHPESAEMRRLVMRGNAPALPSTRPYPQPDDSLNSQGAFELRSRDGELQGLLALAQPDDPAYATPAFLAFAKRLASMLAVAIEMRQLLESQQALFDAIIRVLADAIDAKSPYTGAHCHRMPALAIMLADRMNSDTQGPYADFSLKPDERYAFHLASWLHDCGKITSPEHIVNKATKLDTIYNRIHEIRQRFEILWRDAEITCLQAQLDGVPAAQAQAQRDAAQAALRESFAFIASCNTGGERMSAEAADRLAQLGQQTWQRHFDDSLGLSTEELARLHQSRPQAPTLPATETLLADRPEHIVPWGQRLPPVQADDPRNTWGFDMPLPPQQQNLGELHNLTVQRGTLTAEDRFAINEHVVQSLLMLEKLPWPKALARVPDMAANHHERMDGQGYPRRLPAGSLPLTDRILGVADVFEALTAGDRPYKTANTLSEALLIMARMCRDGHLDPTLYVYFLRSQLWLTYAQQYMQPEQIDAVEVETLAAIAQAASDAPTAH